MPRALLAVSAKVALAAAVAVAVAAVGVDVIARLEPSAQ
jgi:hypothetical protein